MNKQMVKKAAQPENQNSLLQAMIDSSMDMIQVLKAVRDEKDQIIDFVWILNNHRSAKLYGDLTGKNLLTEKPQVWKEDIFDTFKKVVETGIPDQSEKHYVFDQFNGRFYQSVVKLNDGVAITATDITALKKAEIAADTNERKKIEQELRESERRKTFLLKLSDDLRSVSDAAVIHEKACYAAIEYFGSERCYYCEIENEDAIIRKDACIREVDSVAGKYALNDFPILKAIIDKGQPFVVEDARTTDTLDENIRQICIRFGIISYVDVPVIKEGKPVGILCITQSKPRVWSEHEVELAVELAERIWAAVERSKAENALQASEEKYRMLFDSMDEGYCIIQMLYGQNGEANDWRFLQVNRAFELNNGLHNAEGKTIKELTPGIEEKWITIYDRVARTGKAIRFEEDSEALRRIFSLYAFRIGNPAERKVAVIFTDITARKKAEEALRVSEERYRHKLEAEVEKRINESAQQSLLIAKITTTVPDMISVINLPSKSLRFINDEEFRTQGFDPDMMHAQTTSSLSFLVHPDDRPVLQQYYAQVALANDEEVITAEYRARGNESVPWSWYNVRGKVFTRNEDGKAEDILNVIQNITESKASQQQLNELNKTLAIKNRELESLASELKTFTSIAASDYKEPLQNVYTALEFIVTGEAKTLSNGGRANLRRAQSALQKLNLLTEDIIAFANIRKEESSFSNVNLNAVMKLVLYDLRVTVTNTAANIQYKELPIIQADALQMHLLFSHLIANALKFRKENSIPSVLIESEISEKSDADHLQALQVVRIIDNGIGFEQKDADKIFNIFVRLNDKKYKGSGTGLAICKKIMEQHGGLIKAFSSPGEGTMIECWFPVV